MCALGFLAPFAPTPPRALRWLKKNLKRLLATASRGQEEKQPVVYEAGCGEGMVARLIADLSHSFVVCLELDAHKLAYSRRASLKEALAVLVEHVQGDLSSFYLRRVDLVYAYLFPQPMKPLYDSLPKNTILVSLDFPVPSIPPREYHVIGSHAYYVYVKDG